ncbi:hypothetical protein WN943_020247 [Citrus x changshan-huyou]
MRGRPHSIAMWWTQCFGQESQHFSLDWGLIWGASRYTLSRTTLELPGITPSSRSGSLHPLPLEPPSPSNSNGSHKGGYWHVQLPMVGTVCTISSVCQLAHSNHVGQAWHTSNNPLAGLSWAGLYWKLSGFMLCAGLPGLVYTTSLQSSDSILLV